jgi:hypothetical protein
MKDGDFLEFGTQQSIGSHKSLSLPFLIPIKSVFPCLSSGSYQMRNADSGGASCRFPVAGTSLPALA